MILCFIYFYILRSFRNSELDIKSWVLWLYQQIDNVKQIIIYN